MGQLGFNNVRGGSIREPLSTQTEQRVANRGAPIRTPCRVKYSYIYPVSDGAHGIAIWLDSYSSGDCEIRKLFGN